MKRLAVFLGTALVLALTGPSLASAQSAAGDQSPEIAPPSCDYGAPHPDAPAELAQFDFLIGDYTVTAHAWRNEAWTPPRPGSPARWNGYYALGGMAIADEWFDPDPGHDPQSARGINVRMWDADANAGAGEWDMMWVHTNGKQVQDLRAAMIEGKLTMWQEYPDRPNFRAYFERLGPDGWHRITLAKDEAGEWQPTFKLVATRIPCGEN